MQTLTDVVITPIGRYRLTASPRGLVGVAPVEAGEPAARPRCASADATRHLAQARAALADYFAGRRRDFDDLALDLASGTPFQQRVWRALRRVPWGATCSYGELARRVGNERAARAVGAANGRNPLSIVIPCHRIVGADGSLTGYAYGVDRKRWLLAHEARADTAAAQATSKISSRNSPRAHSRSRASAPASI